MDFYHTVFFDAHLCPLPSKHMRVAGFSAAVLPYLTLWQKCTITSGSSPTATALERQAQPLPEKGDTNLPLAN